MTQIKQYLEAKLNYWRKEFNRERDFNRRMRGAYELGKYVCEYQDMCAGEIQDGDKKRNQTELPMY